MSKKHRLKFDEVRKLTAEELGLELNSQRTKLFNARSQAVTEKVEDLSQFGDYKRNIARLLTEQNSRRTADPAKTPAKASGRKPAKSVGKPAAKSTAKSGAKAAAKK